MYHFVLDNLFQNFMICNDCCVIPECSIRVFTLILLIQCDMYFHSLCCTTMPTALRECSNDYPLKLKRTLTSWNWCECVHAHIEGHTYIYTLKLNWCYSVFCYAYTLQVLWCHCSTHGISGGAMLTLYGVGITPKF